MNKHAYLIMYHDQIYILEKLLLLLDDERHDIYIHVDEKNKVFDFEYCSRLIHKSSIFFVPRRKVYWGHVSLVGAEFSLFKSAYCNAEYSFYHLLSGVDMPIKSIEYIYDFFEKNKDSEFVEIQKCSSSYSRVQTVNIFPKCFKLQNRCLKTIFNYMRIALNKLQILIRYDCVPDYFKPVMTGSNWLSLTSNAVALLLKKEAVVLKIFRYACCADEYFAQTVIYNSSLKNNLYRPDEGGCNMRAIDWQRGFPYTYRITDFDELMNSDKLFARKFNINVDKEIVDRIFNKLISEK